MDIKIIYNGEYPRLCRGELSIIINGKKWDFPNRCLESGGNICFSEESGYDICLGDWTINEWPDKFPEEYKQSVISAINKEIPHGCCGGCI